MTIENEKVKFVESKSVNLTLTSLYILRELELRIKYRSWKLPEDSPNPKMLRSSLNFIIPCLDASTLLAGGQNERLLGKTRGPTKQ